VLESRIAGAGRALGAESAANARIAAEASVVVRFFMSSPIFHPGASGPKSRSRALAQIAALPSYAEIARPAPLRRTAA
jgi:hypothetical protein